MKARRRLCLRSDGTPKARYASRREAWRAVRRIEALGAEPDVTKAYDCPDCAWFHIGRPRRMADRHNVANFRRRRTSW